MTEPPPSRGPAAPTSPLDARTHPHINSIAEHGSRGHRSAACPELRVRSGGLHHGGVITGADVIPLLLQACPSFRAQWDAYAADPTYDESLLYLHLGEFARHLVRLLKSGSTGEFAAVFDAVERLHVEGDSYVKQAATIGLLEGLQNNAEHAGLDPGAFLPFLRPESAKWWAELNAFWDGIHPVIKERAWLEEARRGLAASGVKDPGKAGGVHEDYNGALVIFYAEDREKGIAYLTDDQLASTGLARTDLRSIAVQNLRALLPDAELRGGDGTYMVTAGGNYEASLLLWDGLWDHELAGKVKGEVVVAVPSRDVLLVTGSRDAAGVAKVRRAAQDVVRKATYFLTDQLFIRRGGTFVSWDGTS